MKRMCRLVALVVLTVTPSPCFALWGIHSVNKADAKNLGMQVRSTLAGPNHVIVELEFTTTGKLKGFTHVDLRVGEGDNPLVTAPLREERPTPNSVVVKFTAERNQLAKLSFWIMVPETLGGTVYQVQVKDFVELKKE